MFRLNPVKFNILIECLEAECSVINFHWHPALHYHVAWPNYICINDVLHYDHELGRHYRGVRMRCAVLGCKSMLGQHLHQRSVFVMNHRSVKDTRVNSGRWGEMSGFVNSSNGLHNYSHADLCDLIVCDQWKIHLSHLIMSHRPNTKTVQFIMCWPLPITHLS